MALLPRGRPWLVRPAPACLTLLQLISPSSGLSGLHISGTSICSLCCSTPGQFLLCAPGSTEPVHCGRTLKGDDKDPQVAKDAQEAFELALAWFQKHVKS